MLFFLYCKFFQLIKSITRVSDALSIIHENHAQQTVLTLCPPFTTIMLSKLSSTEAAQGGQKIAINLIAVNCPPTTMKTVDEKLLSGYYIPPVKLLQLCLPVSVVILSTLSVFL